jgi:NTE family protein
MNELKKAPDGLYKTGFALSGGGIKGLCHAGVLKALEEKGIFPDIISGVSAGAVVGALYADGYSPDEIADFRGH